LKIYKKKWQTGETCLCFDEFSQWRVMSKINNLLPRRGYAPVILRATFFGNKKSCLR